VTARDERDGLLVVLAIRPPLLGVGESIAGFSLSLPWAVTESCATGHP